MKVLVTGATGFVGSALVKLLTYAGKFDVQAAIRRGSAVLPVRVPTVRISDICGDTDWSQALAQVETVVHLAARVHVMRDAVANPLAEFRRVNLDGSLNLALQAAEAGVRRFVFVSSVKVNGESYLSIRQREHERARYTERDPVAPKDAYGISKLEAEQALRQIGIDTGMEVIIIRPPLIYGPHVRGNFARLLRWVEKGIPLPFANVDNRRSLLNVQNLADLIRVCLEHPAAAGETFLASDDEDLSMAEIVIHLAAGMGKKAKLFPIPLPLSHSLVTLIGGDEVWFRLFGSLQVSCDKARTLLGWRPPTSVGEGLEQLGRWYVESKKR